MTIIDLNVNHVNPTYYRLMLQHVRMMKPKFSRHELKLCIQRKKSAFDADTPDMTNYNIWVGCFGDTYHILTD